jgi:hypothetical protein
VQEVDLEADLVLQPNSGTKHFFVNIDNADPDVEEEAMRFDPDVFQLLSLTRFLTLPIVAVRAKPRKTDPIINFTKSIVLTSYQYMEAAQQLQNAREEAARDKDREREEKIESMKQKVAERKEASARKAVERAAVVRLREERAAERAAALAAKAVEKEAIAWAKATKAAEVAATRVAHATEKAYRLAQKTQDSQLRKRRVAE